MVAVARKQLREQAFTSLWAQGRSMSLEQALTVREPTPALPAPSSTPDAPAHSSPANLSSREVEVLRLIAQGLTNDQVAEQLVISSRTVHTHLTSIYGKIGVPSRSAATSYAIEHHLI
jgi:DNA-binding NarL/FixJ family response regulator